MARKRRLVVLDFDGTLFFTDKANIIASKEIFGRDLTRKQFRKLPNHSKNLVNTIVFSKYPDLIVSNRRLIRKIRNIQTNRDVILLTAKSPRFRKNVKRLTESTGIKFRNAYHRGNLDIPDEVWKLNKIRSISGPYKSVEVYEDKLDNLDYISKRLKKGKYRFYIVTKNAIKPYA